ncbi:glutamate receptor ionotropic, delta-1-like [Macrobrachium rosenbergii]|uniref:glutamate receptor ionotropic, delta-1-like n=1 Tax=Macrobrachium rosenbergii TaxID=79674 RepID=UPI0034D793DE
MEGREMIVTALDSPPFVIMGRELPDGGAEGNTGTDYLFVEAMARTLNFTFRTIQPEDCNYGYPQPDGNVTGMIGLVARREANVALGGIAVNDKRDTVIDYVYPYMDAPLCVYSRSPKQKSQALAVLSPFTREVKVSNDRASGPWLKVLWDAVESFMDRGSVYSGTLTAVLAIPAYEKPIDSLDDLPKAVADGFTIGVVRDSTNEYVFKILTEKFVFLIDDIEFIIAAERLGGRRKFNYGHECFYPQGAAFPVPSGAPYREIFSKLTLRLVAGGFYKKWEADAIWNYTRGSEVEAAEESETNALTLTHLQGKTWVMRVNEKREGEPADVVKDVG